MEKIGFIGAGKVGTALGVYFYQSGLNVTGYYNRHMQKAINCAKLVDGIAYSSMHDLIDQSDIIFMTVPDKVIGQLASSIASSSSDLRDKTIVHCSGALKSTILEPCHKRGADIASIHPLQAFSGGDDVSQLKSTFLTIESEKTQENNLIRAVIKAIKNPYKWISPDQKVLYHSAAVVMSNYMVTLVEEGLCYLREIGYEDEESLEMMMPLMVGTLKNIKNKGTAAGLTGPIVRGDMAVIDQHIEAIDHAFGSDGRSFYETLGKKTVEMLVKNSVKLNNEEALVSRFN